jgi:hypothetical protein
MACEARISAITEQPKQMRRHGRLAAMRPVQHGSADRERNRSSLKRFQRHCTSNHRRPSPTLRTPKGQTADRMHCLGAIEQREAFLGP